MSIRDNYSIKPITYKQAMDMVVENHYLHRKAPCSFAFGLVENSTDKIVGVVIYGTPSSSTLRSGICGTNRRTM